MALQLLALSGRANGSQHNFFVGFFFESRRAPLVQHTEENTVSPHRSSAPTAMRTGAVRICQIAAFVCTEFWLFNQIHSLQKEVKRGTCKQLLQSRIYKHTCGVCSKKTGFLQEFRLPL